MDDDAGVRRDQLLEAAGVDEQADALAGPQAEAKSALLEAASELLAWTGACCSDVKTSRAISPKDGTEVCHPSPIV